MGVAMSGLCLTHGDGQDFLLSCDWVTVCGAVLARLDWLGLGAARGVRVRPRACSGSGRDRVSCETTM